MNVAKCTDHTLLTEQFCIPDAVGSGQAAKPYGRVGVLPLKMWGSCDKRHWAWGTLFASQGIGNLETSDGVLTLEDSSSLA